MQKRLKWETWVKRYQPVKNLIDTNASYDGMMFETFGEELAHVKEQDVHNVWTLIEEDDKRFLLNGWHFVNRLGYFVTKKPWRVGDELEVLED